MFVSVNKDENVIVSYRIEAYNADFEKLASSMANHSSIGSTLSMRGQDFSRFAAKVVDINDLGSSRAIITIAYPLEILEFDNLPQLLSVISSNSFAIEGIDKILVEDIDLPDRFINANRGATFGIVGIRDKLRIHDRPFISTVVKPKVGINPKDYAKLAYEAFVGGIDIVRDDENLADLDINPFYERVNLVLHALKEAERVTGQKKMYIPNLTAKVSEMYARAKFVEDLGGTAGMIDVEVVGISGVQFMRDQNLDLCLYGHRIMDGPHLKEEDGLSTIVVAKVLRLAGIDMINVPSLRTEDSIKKIFEFLRSPWNRVNSVLPVLSGGLHVGHLEKLLEMDGKEQIINMGNGVFSHPDGPESGARAFKTALEGILDGKSLRKIARDSIEVKRALDKWGVFGEEEYSELEKHTNLYPLMKLPSKEIVIKESEEIEKYEPLSILERKIKSLSVRDSN